MIVEKQPLSRALSSCLTLSGKKMSLPILSSILAESNGKELTLRATDFESEIVRKISCEGDFESICVPASILNQLVSISEDSISIKSENGRIIFESGAKSNFAGLPAAEFAPSMVKKTKQVGVNTPDLADAIKAVSWAASIDPSRQNLQGVNCILSAKEMRCIASCGRIIAIHSALAICSDTEFLIPSPAVSGITSELKEKESVFQSAENCLVVRSDAGYYAARKTEEKYPNLKPVTDLEVTQLGMVNRAELLQCATTITACSATTMDVDLVFDETGLDAKSSVSEFSFHRKISGSFLAHKCRASSGFLVKVLKNMDGEQVTVSKFQAGLVFSGGNLTVYMFGLTIE